MPTPEFKSSIGGEGTPLNFLTGEVVGEEGQTWAGAQVNLLDSLLHKPEGTSLFGDLFDRSPLGNIDQNQLNMIEDLKNQFPNASEEELLEAFQAIPFAR